MFSPQQFANVPPPTSISNLPGFQPPQQQPGTFSSIFGGLPPPPSQQPAPQSSPQPLPPQSYPNVSFAQTNPSEYAQAPSAGLQTYGTYPQQFLQGTAVTTPISLPGMPPITVSATIPPQQYQQPFTNANEQPTAN